MCSELTPRARIPDTRIPQLMQPCQRSQAISLANLGPTAPYFGYEFGCTIMLATFETPCTIQNSSHPFQILCSFLWVGCHSEITLLQNKSNILGCAIVQALTTCWAFSQRIRPGFIVHSACVHFFVTFAAKVLYLMFCNKMRQFLI